MAFDIKSAKPIEGGFDISTAVPFEDTPKIGVGKKIVNFFKPCSVFIFSASLCVS